MEVEAMVAMLKAVSWMSRARPTAKGKVAVHDDVMYCKKAFDVDLVQVLAVSHCGPPPSA